MSGTEKSDSSSVQCSPEHSEHPPQVRFGLREIPNEANWRGNLLVVVTLIATLSFQLGTNLPGGYWQDDEILHKKGDPVPNLPGVFYASTVYGHRAGEPILSDTDPLRYAIIKISTGIGFFASLLTSFWLLSGGTGDPAQQQVHLRPRVRLGIDVSYLCALVSFIISEPKIPTLWAIVLSAGIGGSTYVLVRIFQLK